MIQLTPKITEKSKNFIKFETDSFKDDHVYYENYCNIPKNASTSLDYRPRRLQNFCFTVLRDPLSRFKSGLNFLGIKLSDYVINNYDQTDSGLSHLLPQTFFIDNFENIIVKYYILEHTQALEKEFGKLRRDNAWAYSEDFINDFNTTLPKYQDWFHETYARDLELYKLHSEANLRNGYE